MADKKSRDTERVQDAKQKLDAYRREIVGDDESSDEKENQDKRDLSDWTDIVGQRIEQAMREGAFDNLPGQGKPLDLNKNPFVPEDRQMAYKLLENNDLAPSWISERTSVLNAIERIRTEVHDGVHRHQAALQSTSDPATVETLDADWRARLEGWSAEVRTLNKRIEAVNLEQPIAHLEIFKLRLPDELSRAGAGADLRPQ